MEGRGRRIRRQVSGLSTGARRDLLRVLTAPSDVLCARVTVGEDDRGFSVRYPAPWHRASTTLTPQLSDPHEILAVGSYPLRPGAQPHCVQYPVNAIEDLAPTDALVWVAERQVAGPFPPRRGLFLRSDLRATDGIAVARRAQEEVTGNDAWGTGFSTTVNDRDVFPLVLELVPPGRTGRKVPTSATRVCAGRGYVPAWGLTAIRFPAGSAARPRESSSPLGLGLASAFLRVLALGLYPGSVTRLHIVRAQAESALAAGSPLLGTRRSWVVGRFGSLEQPDVHLPEHVGPLPSSAGGRFLDLDLSFDPSLASRP